MMTVMSLGFFGDGNVMRPRFNKYLRNKCLLFFPFLFFHFFISPIDDACVCLRDGIQDGIVGLYDVVVILEPCHCRMTLFDLIRENPIFVVAAGGGRSLCGVAPRLKSQCCPIPIEGFREWKSVFANADFLCT